MHDDPILDDHSVMSKNYFEFLNMIGKNSEDDEFQKAVFRSEEESTNATLKDKIGHEIEDWDFEDKKENEQKKYDISDRSSTGGLGESAQRDSYVQAYKNAGRGFPYLSPSSVHIGKSTQDTTSFQDLEASQEIESSILDINNNAFDI